MSYQEAKAKYAKFGVDADAAIEKLKTVPNRQGYIKDLVRKDMNKNN